MLEKLFAENRIMMCGDYFQTIYAWRGSNPGKILQAYTEDHHAEVHMFRENYRSTENLANASFGYLKRRYPQLIGRYCPKILSIHSKDVGEKIQVRAFKSYTEEAGYVYNYLRNNMPDDPSKICVMARSNRYLASMASIFDSFNEKRPPEERLRFFTVERDQAFYKTPAIKDLLAFYRILLNNTDNLSMERIALNFINRVGIKTIEQIHSYNSLGITASSFLVADTYAHADCYYTLLNAVENDNVVVYDTETTGLDLTKDQVIQLTAIRYSKNGTPIDVFNEILIPSVPISQGARDTIPFDVDSEIRKHGISRIEGYRRFSEFVQGSVLVGHNSSRYDAPLVSRELTELCLPQLSVEGQYDTLTLAKQFYSQLPNYKLATLCEAFGVVNEDAHNALGDVKATAAALYTIIREKLVPSAEERREKLGKFQKRFSAFYAFYQSLIPMMYSGDILRLTNCIVDTCRLASKYDTLRHSCRHPLF